MPDATPRIRFPLRFKWILALLAAALVPLGALAFATVRIQRAGLANAERALQISIVDHVGESVGARLDDAAEATHRVGRLLTEGHIDNDDARLDLAREAMARADVLAEVGIYGPDGVFLDAIARDGAAPGDARLAALTPGAQAAAAQPGGTWLPVSYDARGAVLRFAEAMVRGADRRGFVVGTVARDALRAVVAGISGNRFRASDRVFLLDGDVHVLAGDGAGELAVGRSLAGRDLFAVRNVPGSAFGANLGLTTEYAAAGGARMVATLRTLPSRGWAVLVRRPESEAYEALATSRRAFGLAAGLVALVAVAFGLALGSRAVRPVKKLVELTRAYARREFAERSSVRTGDELEVLGGAMTEMAASLAAGEKEIARRAAVETDLSRFLPAVVAKRIAAGGAALTLGGERKAISVLFADVVSFTTFAEGAPPEKVVAFLNELFTVLTEVVFRHEGTVDKFMGDCLMAIFGAPDAQPDHVARALAAAEDMHRFVETSAPGWLATYGVDVKLAIGVAAGDAVVGNLGSESRMEYTAIGDVVNVCARLESIARPGQTLVTADVAAAVKGQFSFAALGSHPLRGRKDAVEVLELQ